MDVPVRKSVKLVGRWAMGSLYVCEHYENPESVPSDAVVQWADDGATMCLRPQEPALTSEADGWAEGGCDDEGSTSRSVWALTPQTWVKVRSWQEGAQTEAGTVKFINERHPDMPTTQIIYSWIDPAWTRSFMIMRRPRGMELDRAFIYMTDSNIKEIAEQVAAHVKTLAQHTSNMLETVDNFGLDEDLLVGWRPLKESLYTPSWTRRRWPRFTPEKFEAHLKEHSNMKWIPDSGPEFVLYNASLTPYNIYVDPPRHGQKAQLAEINGWEDTAYWPRYWVATCPQISRPFVVRSGTGSQDDDRWGRYLSKALVQAGFKDVKMWWLVFDNMSNLLLRDRAGQEYEDWLADLLRDYPERKPGYLEKAAEYVFRGLAPHFRTSI